MNNDRTISPDASRPQSDASPVDSSGKPVNVVERDLTDRDDDTRGVDEVITPSSTRTKEQDVEELNKKTAEIERKVADGN